MSIEIINKIFRNFWFKIIYLSKQLIRFESLQNLFGQLKLRVSGRLEFSRAEKSLELDSFKPRLPEGIVLEAWSSVII